jgi:CO dehydrogenase maturation factor
MLVPGRVGIMKIAVTGKGGTGKTTVAGALARFFEQDGYGVLAVDADPDANLASAIGIPADVAASIVPISRQRELIRERTGADPETFGQMFKVNPAVSDIPDKYCVDFGGIKLLVMGGVRKGGSGCACAENVLIQSLLSEIMLNRDEVVIVDMEAGIEHLGRATCKAVDRMLVVVEPGSRSISTARSISSMGREIGVASLLIVGNKVTEDSQARWIAEHLPGMPIAGMIPYDRVISDADLKGEPLFEILDGDLRAQFRTVYESCLKTPRPDSRNHFRQSGE